MNTEEIERIGAEAAAEEMPEPSGIQAETIQPPGVVEEFADFLDMAAGVAGVGFALPTIAQRFNHAANVQIAAAAVKLCEKYNIDARAVLIGGDSVVGVWLGLAVAVGLPGYGCWQDFKVKRAQEVKEAERDGDGQQQGQ